MTRAISELAGRVEAGSPDRFKLLIEAWEAINGNSLFAKALALDSLTEWDRARRRFVHLCEMEAFLDAAMSLVPEGWWLAGLNFSPADFRSSQDREWHAEVAGPITWVTFDGVPEPQFDCEGGNAFTPALALTAACLRAHLASLAADMKGEG